MDDKKSHFLFANPFNRTLFAEHTEREWIILWNLALENRAPAQCKIREY